MKILAIRGHNLASLGKFAVEFDQAPLDTAGLFAITGPTGAGKSTLLDALCLALFDRVPRLSNAGSIKVGRATDDDSLRVGSNDVRSLLRRGAGEGRAEVDFLGVDGQRYRAIWTVRRSRNRAAGKLQNQEMRLLSLSDDVAIGRTRTEVLGEIQTRLGLSFDQFRRSALLAQNEFAAFLRANAKDRADLLERITGTELYGELSRRAHRRSKEAQEALLSLQREHQTVAPFPEGIRAAREAELADREASVQRAEAALRSAEGERDWYQILDELAEREAEASQALEVAQAAVTASTQRRQTLAAVQAAQPLGLQYQAREQARASLGRATRGVAEASQRQQTVAKVLQQADIQRSQAQEALASATQDRQAANPVLQEARILDTRLDTAQQQQQRLQAEQHSAQQTHHQGEQALQTLQHRAQQAQTQLSQLDTWLLQHEHLQALAEHWTHWRSLCEQLAQANNQIISSTAERATLRDQQSKLLNRKQKLQAQLDKAQQSLDAAETLRAEAEAHEHQQANDDLPARRLTLDAARQCWQEQQQQHQHYQHLCSQQQRQQVRLAEQAARLDALQTRQVELAPQLSQQRASLTEAERALALAETARRVEVQALREGLCPGEPCPVCGSLEHPWGDHSPLVALTDEQTERVTSLRAEVERLSREDSAVEAEQQTLLREQSDLHGHQQALADELAYCQQSWQQSGLAVAIDAAGDWLNAEHQRLHAEAQALNTAESAALSAREAAQQARQSVDKARRQLAQYQQQQSALSDELTPLAQQLQILESRLAQYQERHDEAHQALAEPLEAFPELLTLRDHDPGVLVAAAEQQVTHWQCQQQQRQDAAAALNDLTPQLAVARQDMDHATTQLSQLDATLAAARQQQSHLMAERARLLDGRPADTVEAALDAALNQAQQALESARQVRDGAAEQHQQASLHLVATQEREQLASHDLASQEAQLAQQLTAQGWTEDTLQTLLSHDSHWITTEEAALRGLDIALHETQVRLEERRARLGEHQASTPPTRDRQTLTVQLPELNTTLIEIRELAARVRAELWQDDTRRQQSAELLAQLAAQEQQTTLWATLNELIGSADGSKFRRFAQSLTLETLLVHTNLHLHDLTRRYRLERAPGSDLELQVIDREMGDEVRSVHSLSGGESFLTSLALALGLASLAADRTPVESLFIDEGFGSLDAATLDTALASLDALQAQGRQVGVISHVPALTERIGVQLRVIPRGGGRSELWLEE